MIRVNLSTSPAAKHIFQLHRFFVSIRGIFFTGTVAFSIPLQQLLSLDAFWKGPSFALQDVHFLFGEGGRPRRGGVASARDVATSYLKLLPRTQDSTRTSDLVSRFLGKLHVLGRVYEPFQDVLDFAFRCFSPCFSPCFKSCRQHHGHCCLHRNQGNVLGQE